MSADECVVCMLPLEECGPFTTENYCPLINRMNNADNMDTTVRPHKICVQCRDTIEQKYGGVKIPPYTKNSKVLTCFGCGCRVGDLPIRQEVTITIHPDGSAVRENETLQDRINRWRGEESVCGILWRIFEGLYLSIPIILLTILYARLLDYLNCQLDHKQEDKCYFIQENMDKGFYFIGFILSIISVVGSTTCCVICREDRERNISRGIR